MKRIFLVLVFVLFAIVVNAQAIIDYKSIPIVDAADGDIYLTENTELYYISGTATLSTDWKISATGVASSGMYL